MPDPEFDNYKRKHLILETAAMQPEHAPSADTKPVFYYRPLMDGLFEGPVHADSVGGKMLRDEKPSEWKPLYVAPQQSMSAGSYQARVETAHEALFHDDHTDIAERNARAFEESIETAQAFGMTHAEAVELVNYTFSRPAGDPKKEIGASILTAFSLGIVAGIDVMEAAEAELEKMQQPETIARFRAKRATRHGRGPLPGFDPTTSTEPKEPTMDENPLKIEVNQTKLEIFAGSRWSDGSQNQLNWARVLAKARKRLPHLLK